MERPPPVEHRRPAGELSRRDADYRSEAERKIVARVLILMVQIRDSLLRVNDRLEKSRALLERSRSQSERY